MNLSDPQVKAALRHVGTSAGTAAAILGLLGVITPDQVVDIGKSMNTIVGGLQTAFGGFSQLIVIIGPIAVFWFGKGAVAAQSLTHQLKSITDNKQVVIDGKILVPTNIAEAVPSSQVVDK